MLITASPTNLVTTYNGTRVRVWLGRTPSGTGIQLFIAGLAVAEGQPVDPAEFQGVLGTEPPLELAEALQRAEDLRKGLDLRLVL